MHTKLRVESKGTVTISVFVYGKMSDISKRLYVPDFSVNLLSIRKITERGYIVKFNEHICEVVKRDGNVVVLAKPTDNIYKVLLVQPKDVVYTCETATSLAQATWTLK